MNIHQAKQISIPSLLERLGHPVQSQSGHEWMYLSPLRTERSASFSVDPERNLWFDFGTGEGGDIITLVAQLFDCSNVSEALKQLNQLIGGGPLNLPDVGAGSGRKASIRPEQEISHIQPITHPALKQYLKSRHIDLTLARELLEEVHYRYGEREYFALGMANDVGLKSGSGHEIRNRHFKGTIGPKDVRTIGSDFRIVRIFEGMFDYLAWQQQHCTPSTDGACMILNSVSMIPRQIERLQKLQPTTVELYLDHDETGRTAASRFQTELPNVVNCSGLYAGFHDMAAYHENTQVSGNAQNRSRKPVLCEHSE